MENIHTGVRQRLEEFPQGFRGLHQACGVILLLPLRKPQDNREVRAHSGTGGLDQFDGKARAIGQATAVFIGALVTAFPEELVHQVTVGAVDLHAVHADTLRILGGLGKGVDHVLDVLGGHAVDHHVAILELFHRTVGRHARIRLGADTAHAAHVPQLRDNLAAFCVHGIDHFFPASQRGLTVKMRDVRITVGGLMADHRAFGDDQPYAGGGAAAVVFDHLRIRHATGRERTGHRCHHHTAGQLQCTELEGFEQGLDRHGSTPRKRCL